MLKYLQGDASRPVGEDEKHIIIAHIVNDMGVWGGGFVIAVSKRWPEARAAYIRWQKGKTEAFEPPFGLGAVQFFPAKKNLVIANMVGQNGVGLGPNGQPPIRYDALRTALFSVSEFARQNQSEVHMPFIGCGLAGGNWNEVRPLVKETLCDQGVPVTIYDFTGEYWDTFHSNNG